MQSAKDSFFQHLRDRLQQLNPQRTVDLNGSTRPALVVLENEPAAAEPLPGVFYLQWLGVRAVARTYPGLRPLQALDAELFYFTRGTAAAEHGDRGRTLAALDRELLEMCAAGAAPKLDLTQSPPVALNSSLLWAPPALGAVAAEGDQLRRAATLTILFFPEVNNA
jgi:hypothetical protein